MRTILSGRARWWVGGLLAWALAGSAAFGQVKWTVRTSPINSTLEDVAYGNATFVAVALDGTMAVTTNNGATWAKVSPNLTTGLTCVGHGNGLFVAMGLSGAALTSTDGLSWELHNTGVNFSCKKVIYANGLFVAVGVSGTILTSSNGKTWTKQAAPNSFGGTLNGVTFGAGKYVATGTGGTILTSTDATTWTTQTSGTGTQLYDTVYGGGNFTVSGGVGLVLTSTNASSWSSKGNTLTPTTSWWGRVAFASNNFVGVGLQGAIMTSPTGHVWTGQTSGTSNQLYGIAYGNNVYVAVGSNGIILTSPIASPAITKQPASTSVTGSAKKTVSFKVKASGSGKLTYQWLKGTKNEKNNSRYSGTTTATFTIKNVIATDAGTYQVKVSNSYGSTLSATATLTVKK